MSAPTRRAPSRAPRRRDARRRRDDELGRGLVDEVEHEQRDDRRREVAPGPTRAPRPGGGSSSSSCPRLRRADRPRAAPRPLAVSPRRRAALGEAAPPPPRRAATRQTKERSQPRRVERAVTTCRAGHRPAATLGSAAVAEAAAYGPRARSKGAREPPRARAREFVGDDPVGQSTRGARAATRARGEPSPPHAGKSSAYRVRAFAAAPRALTREGLSVVPARRPPRARACTRTRAASAARQSNREVDASSSAATPGPEAVPASRRRSAALAAVFGRARAPCVGDVAAAEPMAAERAPRARGPRAPAGRTVAADGGALLRLRKHSCLLRPIRARARPCSSSARARHQSAKHASRRRQQARGSRAAAASRQPARLGVRYDQLDHHESPPRDARGDRRHA